MLALSIIECQGAALENYCSSGYPGTIPTRQLNKAYPPLPNGSLRVLVLALVLARGLTRTSELTRLRDAVLVNPIVRWVVRRLGGAGTVWCGTVWCGTDPPLFSQRVIRAMRLRRHPAGLSCMRSADAPGRCRQSSNAV